MNEPQTDTPRTDHIESALGTASQQCHPTIWMHARQLERELAAATKERDEIPNCIAALEIQAREYRKVMLEIVTKNETLKQQRDTLAEALREILKHTPKGLSCYEFPHSKCDQNHGNECPPTTRFRNAWANAEKALDTLNHP